MTKKLRKPPAVEVTWDDACTDNGSAVYHKQARTLRAVPRHSLGWLVERNAHVCVIAQSVHHGEEEVMMQDFLTIPAGMVRRVRRLPLG